MYETCGSGLARDGGVSGAINVDCTALIAGKPAPTGIAPGLDTESVTQCVIRGAHGGEWGLEGAAAEHGHVR